MIALGQPDIFHEDLTTTLHVAAMLILLIINHTPKQSWPDRTLAKPASRWLLPVFGKLFLLGYMEHRHYVGIRSEPI